MRQGSPSPNRLFASALLASALLVPGGARAHEIPADVLVRLLVHAEDGRLTVLVRAPLEAMRDLDWPLRGPGYLDLDAARPMAVDAAVLWLSEGLVFYQDGERLPAPSLRSVRISSPSDRSFSDFDSALAQLRAASAADEPDLVPEQALLDAWFELPVASPRPAARIEIDPRLGRLGLRTTTVIRFRTGDADRVYQFVGEPGRVALDPRWHQAAWSFLVLGVEHILAGIDHLLFLACLVIPYRRLRPLVPIVTSFTVGHSLTLIAAATGLAPRALWFPALIELLIAGSIVVMAIDNLFGPRLGQRWRIAFAFGLVHGFGFSFALGESLQLAGGHLVGALAGFNIGVELGQLAVLFVMLPLLELARRRWLTERAVALVASVLIAHAAWHWMTDRLADLRAYRFEWPALDPGLLAMLMRWAMLGLIVVGALWLLTEIFTRWGGTEPVRRPSG